MSLFCTVPLMIPHFLQCKKMPKSSLWSLRLQPPQSRDLLFSLPWTTRASRLPWWLSTWIICLLHKRLQVWSLDQEDPLKEGTATHSSILVRQRVRSDCEHMHTGLYALFIFSGNFQSGKITLDKSRKMVGAGAGGAELKLIKWGKVFLKN